MEKTIASFVIALGGGSFVLPFVVLLVPAGVTSVSGFWLRCLTVLLGYIGVYWLLSRIDRLAARTRVVGWFTCILFFLAVAWIVYTSIKNATVVAVIAGAEMIAAALSTIGMLVAVFETLRREKA